MPAVPARQAGQPEWRLPGPGIRSGAAGHPCAGVALAPWQVQIAAPSQRSLSSCHSRGSRARSLPQRARRPRAPGRRPVIAQVAGAQPGAPAAAAAGRGARRAVPSREIIAGFSR